MNSNFSTFIGGANTFGLLLIALFFLKFWRKTRDPLFGAFALAFVVFGIGRMVEAATRFADESRPEVYIIRLAAFSIVIYAIARKNLPPKDNYD